MKRVLFCVILLLFIMASAAYGEIWDEAGVLSATDQYLLDININKLEAQIGQDIKIAILTVDTTGSYSIERAAQKACDERMPDAENGILFLLAVKDREFYTCAFGSYIDSYLSFSKLDSIYDHMMSALSNNSFDVALQTFVSELPDAFLTPGTMTPYQNSYESSYQTTYAHDSEGNSKYTVYVMIGAAAIALIVVNCMSASMKKIRPQKSAEDYARNFHLTHSEDIYLYTTTTRHRIQTQSNNTHHGGSHHSSGRSYHGSGRHF